MVVQFSEALDHHRKSDRSEALDHAPAEADQARADCGASILDDSVPVGRGLDYLQWASSASRGSAVALPLARDPPSRFAFLLRRTPDWLWALAFASVVGAAYYLTARLAFWVGTLSHVFAPLWPPNIILFYALLRASYRAWPIYIAAALLAHAAIETQMGMPTQEWAGAFLCNCGVAAGAALGLRLARRLRCSSVMLRTCVTILIVALVAPGIVALAIAAGALMTHGSIGSPSFAKRWFLSNVLNGLILAPLVLSWFCGRFRWPRVSRLRVAEVILIFSGLIVSSCFAFMITRIGWLFPASAFLFVPFLLWASVRFGSRGASGAVFIVAFVAIVAAMQGHGPFIDAKSDHVVFALQLFLTLMSTPLIILAAAVDERQHASAQVSLTRQQLEHTNENLKGVLASISDFYYTLDDKLCITAINPKAASFLDTDPSRLIGRCMLDAAPTIRNGELESAYRKALRGRTSVHLEHQSVTRPGRWLDTNIYPSDSGLAVFSRDITARKRAEHDLRELGGRVLQAQDEERRRIARELHDDTSQNLAAVALNLQRLCHPPIGSGTKVYELVRESLSLTEQSLREIRTLSYLLHPPMLDDIGLTAALRWYIDGFEKRTDIKVQLSAPSDVGRLPPDVEIALFRVVQESLANVHRHSQSKSADVRLSRIPSEVILTIKDRGKGMPNAAYVASGNDIRSLGVGIAGMNARLRQLGGWLEIASSTYGTTVKAIVPQIRLESDREPALGEVI